MSGSITVTTWTEEAEAMSSREVSLQNIIENQTKIMCVQSKRAKKRMK